MDSADDSLYELRFATEVGDLRSRYRISLDDLSAGEVAALVHAVERVCSPFTDVNVELVEKPVFVCRDVWLWRPTAGAQIWLDEFAARWWKKTSLRFRWAQVYALAHARQADAFSKLTTRWAAEKAIVLFALRLPVRGAELADAIVRAYGASPHDAPRAQLSRAERLKAQAETDFASIVARLEVESGIPREEWLWERSLVYTMTAYANLHEFAAAFSVGGKMKSHMMDELDDSLRNLARVKALIVRRVEAKRAKEAAEKAEAGKGTEVDEA